MNSIFIISPYKYVGMWVFDDEDRGLVKEPFVGGADTLIDLATKDFFKPESGFILMFASSAFPGAQLHLQWVKPEYEGNVYFCKELGTSGWLCPALLKYFPEPPDEIFVKVQSLG